MEERIIKTKSSNNWNMWKSMNKLSMWGLPILSIMIMIFGIFREKPIPIIENGATLLFLWLLLLPLFILFSRLFSKWEKKALFKVNPDDGLMEWEKTSILFLDIERYSGKDREWTTQNDKGDVKQHFAYDLTFYGAFGQKTITFSNMEEREEALNAIERAIEYFCAKMANMENTSESANTSKNIDEMPLESE